MLCNIKRNLKLNWFGKFNHYSSLFMQHPDFIIFSSTVWFHHWSHLWLLPVNFLQRRKISAAETLFFIFSFIFGTSLCWIRCFNKMYILLFHTDSTHDWYILKQIYPDICIEMNVINIFFLSNIYLYLLYVYLLFCRWIGRGRLIQLLWIGFK